MKKTEFDNFKKMTIAELDRQIRSLSAQIMKERASLASAGKSNSKSVKEMKVKIAWAKTLISKSLQVELEKA